MGIDEFVYNVIASLIANILTNFMHGLTLSFLKKQRIQSRVSNALTTIVEPLIPFLEREKISEEKQHLIIETCRRELTPFVEDPGPLFKGSLDGRLPEGRAGLYNRYIRGMLGLWDSRKKVKAAGIRLTREERYQILRSIALHMHLAKKDAQRIKHR
jgi:hypothetical protein